MARGLEYGLQEEGFHVLWARNGHDALAQMNEASPDLIVLDIRLPDVSGFDVCRELRAQGHRQPVLMLTARDEEADKVLGLELGADDYLTKPYSLRELISRVRALLRRAYGELAFPASGERLRIGNLTIDLARQQVCRDDEEIDQTDRLSRSVPSGSQTSVLLQCPGPLCSSPGSACAAVRPG